MNIYWLIKHVMSHKGQNHWDEYRGNDIRNEHKLLKITFFRI